MADLSGVGRALMRESLERSMTETETETETETDTEIYEPTRKEYVYFTPKLRARAVAFVRDHGLYQGLLAQAMNISRQTLTHHLKHDANFKAEIDDALEQRAKELETEARRRAIKGVTRRKFDKDGNLIEEEQVYSDRLMERLLEADIDKFKRGPFGQTTAPVGGVLLIPVVSVDQAGSVNDLTRRLEDLSVTQRQLEESEGQIPEGQIAEGSKTIDQDGSTKDP